MNQEAMALPDVLSADDIVELLYKRWGSDDVLAIHELRIGTGYGKDAEQRIDFWAMKMLPSARFRRVAYEIKVSRSDFRKEISNPYKRRRALLLSNEFYFITPPGLVNDPALLPVEAGLIEVHPASPFGTPTFTVVVSAPWRDTPGPSWQFLAAVARRMRREGEQR